MVGSLAGLLRGAQSVSYVNQNPIMLEASSGNKQQYLLLELATCYLMQWRTRSSCQRAHVLHCNRTHGLCRRESDVGPWAPSFAEITEFDQVNSGN